MRIFVAGAKGQLGSELVDFGNASGYEVTATDVEECDLLNTESINQNLDEAQPGVVINCAAWTKVDAAESEQDAALALNVTAPHNLAIACRERGLPMIHISTDYVFDGTATVPIKENDTPNPTSFYGKTKLDSERVVQEANPRSQVVRTAWLYGRGGPNFVLTMLRLALAGKPLRVVGDQLGSPTWTGHLAPALIRLAEIGTPGVYHLTNSGSTSWAEFAQAIVEKAGIETTVIPIATAEYPTPAPRPAYSVLDNAAWRDLGESPLPDWREGLDAYLATRAAQALVREMSVVAPQN